MMLETILLGLAIILLSTLGAILLKKAAVLFSWKRPLNIYLILAGISYTLTLPFVVMALKTADLSLMQPFTAMKNITITAAGVYIYNERFSKRRLMAVICILVGVFLCSVGK